MEIPFDLTEHLERQKKFSLKTFGPGVRTKGVVDHIRKELKEIEEKPHDLEEWIDVILLAFDGAYRSGASAAEIVNMIIYKQSKNESRNWPDWRTMNLDQAIGHVKDVPETVELEELRTLERWRKWNPTMTVEDLRKARRDEDAYQANKTLGYSCGACKDMGCIWCM